MAELGHFRKATPPAAPGYARARDLGRRSGARRGAERRAPLRGARGGARSRSGEPWEAIFVDDGSTDGTFSALTRLHARTTNVRVVRLRRNFGKAAALAAGFAQATGEIVVTIDGDLQDDPAEIPHLLAKLEEGFDLVSGWKAQPARSLAPAPRLEDLQRASPAASRACACTT